MWDLEGLVGKEFYDEFNKLGEMDISSKLALVIYYLIGYLYYNTNNYIRNTTLGINSHEFTTNEEVYKMTGILGISFKTEEKVKIGPYGNKYNELSESLTDSDHENYSKYASNNFSIFEISELVFYGNTDILYHINPRLYIGYIRFYITEPSKIISDDLYNIYSFDDILEENVYVDDLDLLVKSPLFYPDIDYHTLLNNLYRIKEFSEENILREKISMLRIRKLYVLSKLAENKIIENYSEYIDKFSIVYEPFFKDLDYYDLEAFVLYLKKFDNVQIEFVNRLFSISLKDMKNKMLFKNNGLKVVKV